MKDSIWKRVTILFFIFYACELTSSLIMNPNYVTAKHIIYASYSSVFMTLLFIVVYDYVVYPKLEKKKQKQMQEQKQSEH